MLHNNLLLYWSRNAGFDLNHYIIQTQTAEKDDNPQHSLIQEVKSGEILWSFNSADYPELFDLRYTDGDNPISITDIGDYMHFNAFAIDPMDNNLLVSYRNQCAIFKIDRNTGDLLWKMSPNNDNSDFELSASDETGLYSLHTSAVYAISF